MAGLGCGTKGSLVAACELLVVACEIYFHDQRWNLGPLHWEHGVLATGPPGKSPLSVKNLGLRVVTQLESHTTK